MTQIHAIMDALTKLSGGKNALDAALLSNISVIALSIFAAFFAALWLGVTFWVIRDIRSRSRDPFVIILAALLTFVFPILGVILYRILRPVRTIEEKYLSALEEETLIRELERSPKCPGCGREVKINWILCSACHTKLMKKCVKCNEVLELPWMLCPYCGAPQVKPSTAETVR